jgi:predicted aspartyl protease
MFMRKECVMGEVREQITLVNAGDLAEEGRMRRKETEVRRITVDAVVDTGTWKLVMGEKTCERLGLAIVKESMATLAGGTRQPCKITEPVTIRWKDRFTSSHAMVLPGKEEILLGVIPLEDMDLRVNPVSACLEGVHGEEWVNYVR